MEELLKLVAALFSGEGRFILAVFLFAIGLIIILNPPGIAALMAGIISLVSAIVLLVTAFRRK